MTSLKESSELKYEFAKSQAAAKLKQLAKHPFDLTKPGNVTPERLEEYRAESAGYHLLYGTERIDHEIIQALNDLAEEAQALKKMRKMQSGEIMNFIHGFPSENRPVLHTAARDFFEHKNTSKAASDAAALCKKELDKLQAFIEALDKENKFTDIIAVAIGGSDLGPKANYLALEHLKKANRTVHFVSNIDPDDLAAALNKVKLENTLALIISKSGTTLETVTNEHIIRQKFKDAGLKPEEHLISITGQGSPLDNKQLYRETFHIWDWIGGRFSATSMVGGVTLAFAFGFETYIELLKGAKAMDQAALQEDVNENLPLLGALLCVWNRNFLGYPTLAIIPYSQALSRYPAHIQQVDMESNGKLIDQQGHAVHFETGAIIFGEPGTSAQHSFFQLLHQGTNISPTEFIGFKENQRGEDVEVNGTTSQQKLLSNMFAQSLALAIGKKNENPNKFFPGNRPSHILLSKQLTPYSLGALLAYFEHKIAFQGFLWGINSFDQEGVQLGKELANKFIDKFAEKNGKGTSQPYPLGDVYLNFLETL